MDFTIIAIFQIIFFYNDNKFVSTFWKPKYITFKVNVIIFLFFCGRTNQKHNPVDFENFSISLLLYMLK